MKVLRLSGSRQDAADLAEALAGMDEAELLDFWTERAEILAERAIQVAIERVRRGVAS